MRLAFIFDFMVLFIHIGSLSLPALFLMGAKLEKVFNIVSLNVKTYASIHF